MSQRNYFAPRFAVTALIVAAALAPIGAQAQMVTVVDDQPVTMKLDTLDRNLKKEIEDERDQIIKALKGHSQQGSEYVKMQMEAMQRIADAEALNAAMLQKSVARATAESGQFDPAASQCSFASSLPDSSAPTDVPGFFGTGGSTGSSADTSGGGGARGGKWLAGDAVNDLRNRDRGNGDPNVRAGGPALAKSILDTRDKYVGALGQVDPTTDARALLDNRTIDNNSSGRDAQALNALNINLLVPFPPPAITAEQVKTPAGVMETAHREIVRARRSTAEAVVGQIEADQMGGQKPQNLYIPQNYPDQAKIAGGNLLSEYQWMELMVWQRAKDKDWMTKALSGSPSAVVKEGVIIQALHAYIDFKRYELERRVALMEAARFAHELDKDTREVRPN